MLIGVSSSGTGISSEEYASVRINSNHAFSILAAHSLGNASSRFVLVRDPHARSNYTETSITESILKQLREVNPTHRSTGAFWISWPRFLRYFSSMTISTYRSEYFDVRELGQFTTSSTQWIMSYRLYIPKYVYCDISF